ncbi:MAG: hypothetical protein K0M63_09675 [Weeksellaceae bacterium]|nr:hypothetical protein [Weeksellaceae bacterium]
MNKIKQILPMLILLVLVSCNSQKVYSDYDYSYSRSGGLDPVYENFLIKDGTAHYSFEGQGRKIRKDFKISVSELQELENLLTANNFRMIQEDYKKVYDNIGTAISVKKGPNASSKSDASFIMPKDQQRWNNVVKGFQDLLNSKLAGTK